MVAHMSGQGIVKAFGSWETFVEEQRLMRKAAAAMHSGALRAGFTTWNDYIEGTAMHIEELRKVVAAFAGPLKKAFNTWDAFALERQEQRRALLKLFSQAQARAFNSWLEHIDAMAAQQERMRAALVSLSSGLRAGLNTWIEYVAELQAARRALSGFTDLGRRRGFNQWAEWAAERGDMEEALSKAMGSFRHADARKALNSWLDFLESLVPLRHAAMHMLHAALGKSLRSWEEYLDMLEIQRKALHTFVHIGRARALRTWRDNVEELERQRGLLARMLRHNLYRCLRHWASNAREKEAKMQRMRTLVYSLAGGHRCLRALNSWRSFVDDHYRAMRAAVKFVHGASLRAWNKWVHEARAARAALGTMRAALMIAERKALNAWREHALEDTLAAVAASHWFGNELLASFRRWKGCLRTLAAVRHALGHFLLHEAAKALNTWVGVVADAFTLRRALAAFGNAALRKGWNSWMSLAETRRMQLAKARAGVRTMLNLEVRRALNSWKSARQALQPVLRGIAHWRNAPVKKAFNSMCANVRRREYMRAVLFRLQHLLVGKAVRTWQAKIASGLLKRLTRLGAAWVHWPKRKALNTWFAYYRGQRRLRGLVHTFQGTGLRRGFNSWREATKRRPGIVLGAPNNLRSIRAMTWREAVTWLLMVGIRVSRSPPTLLRTLRAGGPYADIIRLCSPIFYARHKVSHIANSLTLFATLQHFFETELVVRVVGCQRLDVAALDHGKAIEHLELLSSLREVVEEVERSRLTSPVDVVVRIGADGVLYGDEL